LSIALLCAVAFLASALPAQQGTTTNVTIRVTDQTGAVVPHAQIRFAPAPDPVPPNLETDDHGERGIDLRAGSYALSVSRLGFITYNRHIDVKIPGGDSPSAQFIPVVLYVGHTDGPYPGATEEDLTIFADPYHAPVTLSPGAFRALPHVSVSVHNAHSDANENYSGVQLAELLAKVNAPLGKELRGKAMTSYVVATGSDGYAVVLSIAEVDPEFHSGEIIVADQQDGHALGKDGPFRLIVSEDKRPARWVRNLVSITLTRTE